MSAHQLATGHPTPGDSDNPIFWTLILLHCLHASQKSYIIQNHLCKNHSPIFVSSAQTMRHSIPKNPQEVSFLQLPGNIKSMKGCSLKCQFDIKGLLRDWGAGYNIAFDEQGCSRYNGLWRKCESEAVYRNCTSRSNSMKCYSMKEERCF